MISTIDIKKLKDKSRIIRRHILEMMKPPKLGHLGGSMSCADIVTTLYYYKMKYKPDEPNWEKRDRLILSKGHSVLAQYAALADLGYFPVEDILNIKEINCHLQGHPDMNKTVGIEANTGSLGQGLSIGIGICLGANIDKYKYNVYVIIGDGELQEGQIWEAAMAAGHYKLDNIIAIVDNNKLQATGFIRERLDIGDIASKWESFGWKVFKINGHNFVEIADALDKADEIKRPVCIIADTIKGKGVKSAEKNPAFHKGCLTEKEYQEVIKKFSNTIS